ncbi:MAG TPA: serine hydrolase [Microlunatus sp.]|nr:serine hydrolase [Microlunatus sp.]
MSDSGWDRPARAVTYRNWQQPDLIHWSFSHVDRVLPTVPISRKSGWVAVLTPTPVELGGVSVLVPTGQSLTVAEVVAATETDAWLVAQHGRILTEGYFRTTGVGSRHLLQSVSKSLVGTVVGALVRTGSIDPARTVATYVPELTGRAYGAATVRQVLDMRSGIGFREDYADPYSDSRILEAITGWAPLPAGVAPSTMRRFLQRLPQVRPHGGPFDYRSCETDVLGLVCEGAAGEPFAELASRLLWTPIGASDDGNMCVDDEGTGVFDGGLCATARDLARFGHVIISEGASLIGRQVLSPAWIEDLFRGGRDSPQAFAAAAVENSMPGGHYRSQFWVPSASHDVVLALGIHGQLIYLDRRLGLVGVKLSSWPEPSNQWKTGAVIAMFAAIGRHLAG